MTTKTKTRDDARRRSLAVVMNVRPSRKETTPPPSFFSRRVASRRVASRRVASRAVARVRLRRNSADSRVSDTQSEIARGNRGRKKQKIEKTKVSRDPHTHASVCIQSGYKSAKVRMSN
jgi:hypothetical protein